MTDLGELTNMAHVRGKLDAKEQGYYVAGAP
jgi:hypothetical protein